MAALPAEPAHDDTLDPERIVGELPEEERATFLAGYRRVAEAAVDPAGWKDLRRFLRLWAMHAVAATEPDYFVARDAARAGTGPGMLLEDALRQFRPGQ